MKEREFKALTKESFGSVLIPHGFTTEGSKIGTFYRKTASQIFHFIIPRLSAYLPKYYIYVFPHSPHIYPIFGRRFPDSLGFATDSWSYLSERGVGLYQEKFSCRSKDDFRQHFEELVKPLLLTFAIPYLDQFQDVADIIPAIRHSSFLGFALHHVGRTAEAREVLEEERQRLQQLDTNNEEVAAMLEYVDRLLRE